MRINRFLFLPVFVFFTFSSCSEQSRRTIISLDGRWMIAEGSMDKIPENFKREVPVPGLVTLARPAFINPAPVVRDRRSPDQVDTLREAYWYKRTFYITGKLQEVARLKVSRAMFGTKVFINGKDAGEHLPCFTPGWFDIRPFLKKGENEIIVRVGSCRNSIPHSYPDGFDFEKERYVPGIFDNVFIVMSGMPSIKNVQAAPDVNKRSVRVQVTLGKVKDAGKLRIGFVVREEKSGKLAGSGEKDFVVPFGQTEGALLSTEIPVENCRFWSPEDPFLYNVTVSTSGDEQRVRFGMREFRLDTVTGKTILNGKHYFMRGSNITLYRFFEDDSCRDLPWNDKWVRELHRSFKKFNWNSLRYCIGIAPSEWYDIADEEGIMIQDEFPVWFGGKGWCSWPRDLRSPELATEYSEWMQDQWNHPSVIIWDASNETISDDGKTEEVAEAVNQVRHLDISGRPWDNSYSTVRSPGDVMELHPYHFQDPKFRLSDLGHSDPNPGGVRGDKRYIKIINEYGWLWLNRDGTPTTLTRGLYKNLLGADSSVARRREVYAMYLAAETEFWRCNREAGAVLHFTSLGYSRSNGQTSDHFADVKNLVYDEQFSKYVADAFSPVGLMLEEWGADISGGKPHTFKISAINDLENDWSGRIVLRLFRDGKLVSEKGVEEVIPGYGRISVEIMLSIPGDKGKYIATASLEREGDKPVKSVREFNVTK